MMSAGTKLLRSGLTVGCLLWVVALASPRATAQQPRTRVFNFDEKPIEGELVRPARLPGYGLQALARVLPRSGGGAARCGGHAGGLLGRAELRVARIRRAHRAGLARARASCGGRSPCRAAPASPPDYRRPIASLRRLVDRAPPGCDADRALFLLASLLGAPGPGRDPRQALRRHAQLVRRFPQSRYLAPSLLAIADHYFARIEMAPAKRIYEKILDLGNTRLRDYSAYKLAWVHFNLRSYRDAARLLDRLRRGASGALARQAEQDLVLALSHSKQPRAAARLLVKGVPQRRALALLSRLASRFEDLGRLRAARDLYQQLLREEPAPARRREYRRILRRLGSVPWGRR